MRNDRGDQSCLLASVIRGLPAALGILGYLLACWVPMAAVFGQVQTGGVSSLLRDGRRLSLFARSVGWAALVGLVGMALGLIVAIVLWRYHRGWRAAVGWLFLAGAALPPYAHILAWWSVLRYLNRGLSSIGFTALPQRGWLVSLWVQVMAWLPVAAGLALVGLLLVESSLIEAGRVFQPDARVFSKIVLPLARPMVLAGGTLLFVLALVDYGIPSTFQFPTAALEVFVEFGASADLGRAAVLAMPVLLLAAVGLALGLTGLRRAALASPRQRRPAHSFQFSAIPPGLLWGGVALILAQAVLPVGNLLLSVRSWRVLAEAFTEAIPELRTSLWTASVAALLAPLLALGPARVLTVVRAHPGVWFLLLLPLAVPGPLVGIGLISLWNRPGVALYSTGWMPVLAALARFTPLAVPVLVAQRRRMAVPLVEAARLFARPWDVWWRVELPLTLPGLISAACLVFVLTLGELGATLIVVPPGYATLTMRIYTYMHYGASEGVAALSLMLSAICLLVGAIGFLVWRLWSRAAIEVVV